MKTRSKVLDPHSSKTSSEEDPVGGGPRQRRTPSEEDPVRGGPRPRRTPSEEESIRNSKGKGRKNHKFGNAERLDKKLHLD